MDKHGRMVMFSSLFIPTIQAAINCAIVELDVDIAAERYAVLDRNTMSLIFTNFKPSSGNIKIVVPIQYTIDHNVMALILDDTGTPMHYVTGNDKIQAQLVDARTVTLNP